MGISPIQYRPWKGARSAQKLRVYVILRSVFRHRLKSTGVKILLILGFLFAYVAQFIIVILSRHEELTAADMSSNFNAFGVGILALLLAAIVTSDLISEDLANSSFVLYFSRAIKIRDYLFGKAGGALLVMSLLCAIPPVLLAIVSMATQTGDDYWSSAKVVGRTVVAAGLMTVFFVPFGLMLSSFTKRKSYAAVGTFMSLFVLTIIAAAFSEFASEWTMISPLESLSYTVDWIYGQTLPDHIDKAVLLSFVVSMTVLPTLILYLRLQGKVVGR